MGETLRRQGERRAEQPSLSEVVLLRLVPLTMVASRKYFEICIATIKQRCSLESFTGLETKAVKS